MDCGRPRQVSELWAALVRTTGLSNLPPPWRACERTGQHLGRGEVTRGTRAGASRASTTVLARRFRADPHEVGRIEGLGLDSLELAEHVDQGQQIEVRAGHEPEDVAPVSSSPRTSDPQPVTPDGTISNRVSSSTRASVGRDTAPGISLLMEWWTIHHRAALQSLARDARRSHRSVEGDVSPPTERERERKPRYYIRGIEIYDPIRSRPVWGGGGLARDFNNQNLIVHLGLGRASWQGTQGLPPPFRRPLRPSCDAVFAPIPTKSGASRASGWILGSWERRRPGPASDASRSLQKIVGAIVGAASRAGREHLQGSSPPDLHRRAGRRSRRDRARLCNMG